MPYSGIFRTGVVKSCYFVSNVDLLLGTIRRGDIRIRRMEYRCDSLHASWWSANCEQRQQVKSVESIRLNLHITTPSLLKGRIIPTFHSA